MSRIEENEELGMLLKEEKLSTAEWYKRMSGQVAWEDGERDKFLAQFENLQRQLAAIWFASLPEA